MRIAVISDTHGRPFTIPECDIFIHCGDMTAGGSFAETYHFANSISDRYNRGLFKHVIIVPGNHDKCFQDEREDTWQCFDDEMGNAAHLLIDSGCDIEGKTFWGSPWTPPFFEWSFMAEEDRLKDIYKAMPDELDVLITHGPPRNILDPGHDKSHVGSIELFSAIAHRTINHHVFGHLHAAGGLYLYSPEQTHLETTFHNVAAVDEAYVLRRECKIIEL